MADERFMSHLSLADRALLMQYVYNTGKLPEWGADQEIKVFAAIAGISEYEATAAFAELEDKGLIERSGDD